MTARELLPQSRGTRYAADTLSTSAPIPAQVTPYSVKGKPSLRSPILYPWQQTGHADHLMLYLGVGVEGGAVEESRRLFPGQYQQASLLPDTAAGRRLSSTKASTGLQELMPSL